MKTTSILFALAISACAVPVPAFAQNAIVSFSVGGVPFSLNSVNYPDVEITPGATLNGPTIATGNINIFTGMFSANHVNPHQWDVPPLPAEIVFSPMQYQGAAGFTNGAPLCFLQYYDGTPVYPKSLTQDQNGDWQLTVDLSISNNNGSQFTTAPTDAQLQDTSNHQLRFFCAAKGSPAPSPQ